MEEEVQLLLEDTQEKMQKSVSHLEDELSRVRAGKASTALLDGISVNFYGALTPLNQVANINTPDPRTISIQPWDKTSFESIEKAIMAANIGLTPMNNGEVIRLNIPPLTEERRRDLVKQIRVFAENTRVSVRNARRDTNEYLKKMKKDGLAEDLEKESEHKVQELTDKYIAKVDKILEVKEKEIMTV